MAMFADTGTVFAFDMCKNMFGMMNQSKLKQSEWMDNYRDRDDYYGYPEVASGYGYDSPIYGYGGPPAPRYGYAVPVYVVPQPGNDALLAEISQLKLQIQNLEKALIDESSQR